MSPLRWLLIAALVGLLAAPAAMAQPAAPRVGYVYPAGGSQGSTFEVTIGGQNLTGVAAALVSGPGVKATVIEHVKPITQQQFNKLRERLDELRKKPGDADTAKEIAELRKQIVMFVNRPSSPAIVETVTLQVTLEPDAAIGDRELRLSSPTGLTNPLVFCVGQLPEFSAKPSKSSDDPGGRLRFFRRAGEPQAGPPAPPMDVTLPAVVNGQILPGGVNRVRFHAAKGQNLVIAAKARELMPYIADAVPGWFEAAMTLYDSKGNEVGYADHFRFRPDPVLYYEVPNDDEYMLEIRDSIYRGREDFVYRITIGHLPFVTGIFPLGCKAGERVTVQVAGWNLPENTIAFDAKDKAPGVYPLSVRNGQWVSNSVSFAVDAMSDCMDKRPANARDAAQKVALPIIVNGRIDQSGQWNVYRFEGRAGDEIVAEVTARRLDSPMDSVLKLTDSAGRQLACNDDHEDKGTGLNTHHADSYLRVKLPAKGTYYVHVGDIQHQSGTECAYRLRLSTPQPDFALRIAPSGINIRASVTVPVTVYALRKDGFSGQIELVLKDSPAGFTLTGGLVPADTDQVRLTLTGPAKPLAQPVNLSLEGRAVIQGQPAVRQAVPAEDMMQAFAYRHLVPAKDLMAAVTGRGAVRGPARIVSETPVKIISGKTVGIRVSLPANTPFGQMQFELNEPPDGMTIKSVSPAAMGSEIMLHANAAKIKPGLKGNLIVNIFLVQKPRTAPANPQVNRRRSPLGTLPAIPFEVVLP